MTIEETLGIEEFTPEDMTSGRRTVESLNESELEVFRQWCSEMEGTWLEASEAVRNTWALQERLRDRLKKLSADDTSYAVQGLAGAIVTQLATAFDLCKRQVNRYQSMCETAKRMAEPDDDDRDEKCDEEWEEEQEAVE